MNDAVADRTPFPRSTLVWLWLMTFGLFAAIAHGNLETGDAALTMQAARGLWQRGDSGLRTLEQGGEPPGEVFGAEYLRQGNSGKVGTSGLAYPWFPVGHVWLLVPIVAAGDRLERAFPEVDARFRERVAAGAVDGGMTSTIQGRPIITQGLISVLVPPACAGALLVLLVLLAQRLGAGRRDAAIAAAAILLATQAFAFGRETLSDGPGLVFLLAALLGVVAVVRGGGSATGSLLAGMAGGAAVLLRYQNAALLVALIAVLGLACRAQRRFCCWWAFGVGTLPAAGLLLAANHARFGNMFDTGYPAVYAWLQQPLWLGATKILFGAGRGVAWFSPLCWLALPLALGRVPCSMLRWLGWVLFLFPLVFFSLANGWQGGECWAARYVTHGLVALLILTLPQTLPWRRWPRTWWTLVLAGVLVAGTSVIAPVRGVQQLAGQAIAAAGLPGDPADLAGWHPRYSPLWINWRYALQSRVGGFEDEQGHPRAGSDHTVAALFGVQARTEQQQWAPVRWEDRVGRHLWWRLWADLTRIGAGWLLLPPLLLAGVALVLLVRSVRRISRHPVKPMAAGVR